MYHTTATVLTIVTAFTCYIPSMRLLCLDVLALFGTRGPEVMMQNTGSITEYVILRVVMALFVGAILLLISILVEIFAFHFSKEEEPAIFTYIPSTS